MICIDCEHAVIRVLILTNGEEEFFSCSLDGQRLIIPMKSCSRYKKANIPIQEKIEMKWGKGRR